MGRLGGEGSIGKVGRKVNRFKYVHAIAFGVYLIRLIES